MPTAVEVCACQKCSCEVQPGKAIQANNQMYCSTQCAEGHPNNEGCDCGNAACKC